MVRFLMTLAVSLLLTSSAMAGLMGGAQPVIKGDGSTAAIAVGTDQAIYTQTFVLKNFDTFGVWALAMSTTGTPDVKVELQQSYLDPTTPSYDGYIYGEGTSNLLWVEPDGFSDVFAQINDEVVHIDTMSPVPMPYGRYKITGSASNASDTIVRIYNFFQGNN
jgi:hypothetical protein